MHPMLTIALQASRQASKHILRAFDQPDRISISEKSANDFVTDVDTFAEQVIIEQIQQAYPSHSILAEEHGTIEGDEYTWIIDPLDGTTNFIHGIPHFAISIAIKKNHDLIAGLIFDPIRNELFTATKGGGARLNHRRIRVSNIAKISQALIGTGFPFRDKHHIGPYLSTFSHLLPQTSDIRRSGSASLDLAYVACGRLDGFWEPSLKAWDMAAGALLIQEAGGMLCDFNGEQDFLSNGCIIAGNPKIHKQLAHSVMETLHEKH